LRKKFHENKEANDFALPADARATCPVHRAQPAGGNVDVACETDLSALDDPVVVETDRCADLFAKVPILLELPVSKVVWIGSTAGESLMILLLVVGGIIAYTGSFSSGGERVFWASAPLSSATSLESTTKAPIGARKWSHPPSEISVLAWLPSSTSARAIGDVVNRPATTTAAAKCSRDNSKSPFAPRASRPKPRYVGPSQFGFINFS
jgi:hypothetical protein